MASSSIDGEKVGGDFEYTAAIVALQSEIGKVAACRRNRIKYSPVVESIGSGISPANTTRTFTRLIMNTWLEHWLNAGAVQKGEVARRNIQDVINFVPVPLVEVVHFISQKGFHLIQIGDQLIVIGSSAPIQIHC
jgi:hypothetical protein